MKFVSKNLPNDTQTFVSISEHIKDAPDTEDEKVIKPIEKVSVKDVKETYFPVESKLFYIGRGQIERGFLSQVLKDYQEPRTL
ncbi:MAG: hypothetical protein V8K32_06915 [Candidatus Electrothrix gigas]